MLRRLRVDQAEHRLRVGSAYHDERLRLLPVGRHAVPPGALLTRVRPQAGVLQPGPPRHPLPAITLHGLRHTWATLALTAGIDIKIVSERLNHSSTHITREIYTHVTPPMQSDAAERVAKVIFGPTLV